MTDKDLAADRRNAVLGGYLTRDMVAGRDYRKPELPKAVRATKAAAERDQDPADKAK